MVKQLQIIQRQIRAGCVLLAVVWAVNFVHAQSTARFRAAEENAGVSARNPADEATATDTASVRFRTNNPEPAIVARPPAVIRRNEPQPVPTVTTAKTETPKPASVIARPKTPKSIVRVNNETDDIFAPVTPRAANREAQQWPTLPAVAQASGDPFAPPSLPGTVPPTQPNPTPAPLPTPVPIPIPAPTPVPVPGPATTPGQMIAAGSGPFEIIDESGEWNVTIRRSKLLRTQMNIYRTAVVDPSVCDVVQFTPREVSLIGKAQGATHVTFWFEGQQQKPLTYLIRVSPDPEVQQRREKQYKIFEEVLAELFPDSKVRLQPVADKLIVKGQARDAEEAAQILAIIRGEAIRGGNRGDTNFGTLLDGRAADPLQGEERDRRLPASQVVNMLRIPGVQTVALRVKIAELNRTAARRFGVDMDMEFNVGEGALLLQSMLNAASGGSASVLGKFDGDKINFGIHFLEQHSVVRVLSEPTLVTLSGRPASFVAGGEFAVPTTVGVGGVSAVTTDFRSFGAILTFLPTVVDKDRVRLEVSPEFSKINKDLSVNNTPGLDTRAVNTTVEMREGQTLAIAGLLDDGMKNESRSNLPFIGHLFGMRTGSRSETELIILVTPELVHPMDPEEVPPLPGFDVREPTNGQFYLEGQIEGRPTSEYRSTVWPVLRKRYSANAPTMISGPFGHGQ